MVSSMEGNWPLQEAEKPIFNRVTQDFKRTFPLDPTHGVLISAAGSTDEVLLEQNRGQYTGVKLMRGMWTTQGRWYKCGTYFPLAAPAGAAVLWASAGRCLVPSSRYEWRAGYGTHLPPGGACLQRAARAVLDFGSPSYGSQVDEYVPSQPTQRIGGAEALPDFGFMLANAPEGGLAQLYVPSARQLACGDPVCVMGFAQPPTADWACTFLRTEAGYEEVVMGARLLNQPDAAPAPEDWRLKSHAAALRALELLDGVCHPSHLAAAPGLVAGASRRIVEHTCSTFPGMSGGPGVDIEQPWQLLFVHTRADADFRRNNYGYSVHHPLFVKAYEREVLPRLLASPPELLSLEMLRCLRGYLEVNKDQLADPNVVRVVEQRC